jgi:hypothetical protein
MKIARAVPDQEHRPSVAHCGNEPWRGDSNLPETGHAERDQGRVRRAARETDRKDVRADEALAQHESVLRAHRDD